MKSQESTNQSYRSFLLRLWRDTQENGSVWRYSLEDVQSREKRHFSTGEELCAFLYAETGRRRKQRRNT